MNAIIWTSEAPENMYRYEGEFREQTFQLLPVTFLIGEVYISIILRDANSVLLSYRSGLFFRRFGGICALCLHCLIV
jgi:hypothetical protein